MPDADRALFVAGLEAAVTDVYRVALDQGKLPDSVHDTVLVLAQHHDEHAGALAAIARTARADVKRNDTLYGELNQTVLGADPVAAILAVEQSLAATHLASLGTLSTTDAAAAVASILPVESQHAVVVGCNAAGIGLASPTLLVPLQTVDGAYGEDRY